MLLIFTHVINWSYQKIIARIVLTFHMKSKIPNQYQKKKININIKKFYKFHDFYIYKINDSYMGMLVSKFLEIMKIINDLMNLLVF